MELRLFVPDNLPRNRNSIVDGRNCPVHGCERVRERDDFLSVLRSHDADIQGKHRPDYCDHDGRFDEAVPDLHCTGADAGEFKDSPLRLAARAQKMIPCTLLSLFGRNLVVLKSVKGNGTRTNVPFIDTLP